MRKTSISVVGSGNVATHLAIAFYRSGCRIHQVCSRSFDHAQNLAQKVSARPTDRLTALDEDVDVCLICVNDDALYDLGLDMHMPDSLVLHTSGSTAASVLKRVSTRYGVLWSPQTFVRDIAMDYSRLPLCVEGCNDTVEEEIQDLAGMVSNYVYHLDGLQRQQAHLAAVMVSNFANAVNATAQKYMEAHGLDFEMLRPLAEQTLQKWDYGDLVAQQTGPARRNDQKTIDLQRRLLSDQPDLLKFYDMMTDIIQSR